MTREEFLQGLKEALDGNMDASAIQENLNYYNEYLSLIHISEPTRH